MTITNTNFYNTTDVTVSFVGSQITVKIPEDEVPDTGLPFGIFTYRDFHQNLISPTTSFSNTTENGVDYRTYFIPVDSTLSYTVVTVNSSGTMTGFGTGEIIQGESYFVRLGSPYSSMYVKNLDDDAPALVPFSPQVPIPTVSEFNSTSDLPDIPIDVSGNKAYYVAKFSEGVVGVTNQSFIVTQNGATSQAQTVEPLWLTGGTTWSLSRPFANYLPASHYLVTVSPTLDPDNNPIVVTLKSAPPAIVSVQEMNAMPLSGFETSGNSTGNHPGPMTTPGSTVSWLKITLEDSATQFLLDARTVPGSVPMLEYTYAENDGPISPNSWGGFMYINSKEVSPSYAVQGTNPNVIYLGFSSGTTAPYDAPASIELKTIGLQIFDRVMNLFGTSASDPAPQYLDAAGELVFSPIWERNTTTISDASVFGYANGANVLVDEYGVKEYLDGYDFSLPSYFTRGKPLGKDLSGNPTYDLSGDRVGLDTIDLSGITGGPMVINADDGEAFVYSGDRALVLDVSDYDRYILNDRASGSLDFGNEFYGTVDSEYVVVGSGGDNYLVAGNQGTTDISATVIVKNYQFNSTGIVAETDIVDYSQLATGITVHLGDRANAAVSVVYKDGPTPTQADTLFGFEGVVGSSGNDEISGSNVGNVLAGGAGNDELRGYTPGTQMEPGTLSTWWRAVAGTPLGDRLYDQTYLATEYGIKGTSSYKEAQFLVDSSDILYGGAGDDKLYGGAGRDMLIDLGEAEMWGSNTGRNLFGTDFHLRSSADKTLAENDVFWVRGDGAEKATINNFHLSKDGTGLAGRSTSANDVIMFSIDKSRLFGFDLPGLNGFGDAHLYNHVYSGLTFEQIENDVNDDIELVINFRKDNNSPTIKVGSTIIADMGSMLDGGKNRVEVVELKWLSKGGDPLALFNPKIDIDFADFVDSEEFGSSSMNIAVALELLQAGTVRGTNDYGVMAAKLSDNDLNERVYNPGDKDDRILGTTSADSYEYIVQQFTATPPATITPPGETPTPPAVITNQVGRDAIFDTGGNDVLMFESASIQDLTFSAVKVGRESKANSLKVVHKQTETLDDGDVKNEGEVVWQGHYKEGGRQAAEVLKIKGQEFDIAQAVYDYNAKGYVKGGPEITASSARDVIMVGQGEGDKFVFDFTPAPASTGIQTARIAGFGLNDKIDISKLGLVDDSVVTHNTSAGMDSTARIEFTSGFVLNLSFQGAVSNEDLNFALGATLFT